MADLFYVDIVSPRKVIYSGDVSSLIVPSELGYLGVLANHAPLVARLVKGKITLKDNSNKSLIFHNETQGFIEVSKNKATVILDSFSEKTS